MFPYSFLTNILTYTLVDRIMVSESDEAETPCLPCALVSNHGDLCNVSVLGKHLAHHVLCRVIFHAPYEHLGHRLLGPWFLHNAWQHTVTGKREKMGFETNQTKTTTKEGGGGGWSILQDSHKNPLQKNPTSHKKKGLSWNWARYLTKKRGRQKTVALHQNC